jgi:flavodoxin
LKILLVYVSKTGNTEKVARSFARGLGGEIDVVKLDLSPEGVLKEFQPKFTLDAGPYDLFCLAAWVMVMKVHPFLASYIRECRNLEGKKVAVCLTGGAGLSRNHAYEDLLHVLEEKKVKLIGFSYTTTLLGLTLTRKKLEKAEQFGEEMRRLAERGD